MINQTDLLDYLSPSSITRLLYALRLSRKSVDISYATDRGKQLMSIEREFLSDTKEIDKLKDLNSKILFAGKDIYNIKEYIWDPLLELDSVMYIWIIIVDPSSLEPKSARHMYTLPTTISASGSKIYRHPTEVTNRLACLDIDWHTDRCINIASSDETANCNCYGLVKPCRDCPTGTFVSIESDSSYLRAVYVYDDKYDELYQNRGIIRVSLYHSDLLYKLYDANEWSMPYLKLDDYNWNICDSRRFEARHNRFPNYRDAIYCDLERCPIILFKEHPRCLFMRL